MKKILMLVLFISCTTVIFAASAVTSDIDGTPDYRKSVKDSYRKLQIRTSIYDTLPKKGSGIRLGIYQAEAKCGPGASAANLLQLEQAVAVANKYNVQLLAFPELYIPGYTLSPDEAKKVSEFKDGKTITQVCKIAAKNKMALVVPYAEKAKDKNDELKYYDSIAVVNEKGILLTSYHKTHLYGQQERDNWSTGDGQYDVFSIFDFPVAVLNCYECEFPELSRILALKGAKLIVGPTAADNYYRLPKGERSKVPYPDVAKTLFQANAYANNIFFAYANRCGYEARGGDSWHYRGNSIVYGPHGDVLAEANHEQDTLLIADCIPAYYGMTHPAPNYYYLKDRRPALYGELVTNNVQFKAISPVNIDLKTKFGDSTYSYED